LSFILGNRFFWTTLIIIHIIAIPIIMVAILPTVGLNKMFFNCSSIVLLFRVIVDYIYAIRTPNSGEEKKATV
jgi:hypothetical protein